MTGGRVLKAEPLEKTVGDGSIWAFGISQKHYLFAHPTTTAQKKLSIFQLAAAAAAVEIATDARMMRGREDGMGDEKMTARPALLLEVAAALSLGWPG